MIWALVGALAVAGPAFRPSVAALPLAPRAALRCSAALGGDRPKRVRAEVVIRLPAPPAPPVAGALSEEAVARVLEVVWRDSRMILRTALQRPMPVVAELVTDRLPMAGWFLSYRSDQSNLMLNRALIQCKAFRIIAPRAAAATPAEIERLERRLELSRSRLWPTLRNLLLRPSTHARVVQAARVQIASLKAVEAGYKNLLRTPVRAFFLWVGLIRSLSYGFRWVLVELARRGSLLSQGRQARWRISLIERGIMYGVVLMRRVERIELERPLLPGLPAVGPPAAAQRSLTGLPSAAALEGAVVPPPYWGLRRRFANGAARLWRGLVRDVQVLWSTTVF